MAGLYPDAPNASDVPFSDLARQLLAAARAESDRLRHEYIGTEHLVLAMTQDANSAALLMRLGIKGENVRASLDAIVKPGHATLSPGAERPYTSRTRQAFAFAVECAGSHGHTGVGVEHLIVGLLRERMNLGAQILQHHGLSMEQAAAEVQRRGSGASAE